MKKAMTAAQAIEKAAFVKSPSFLEDTETRTFADEQEFMKFLDDREATDEWADVPTSETKVMCVADDSNLLRTMGPSVLPERPEEDYEGFESSSDALADAMAEQGYVISFWDNSTSRWRKLPMRYTALGGLCYAAKTSGEAVTTARISPQKRGAWLTDCLSVQAESLSRLLLRDGKVGAFRTGKYQPLSARKLIEATAEALPEESAFDSAFVSHDHTIVRLAYGGEQEDLELAKRLQKIGVACKEVYRTAMFVTSDTGNDAAKLFPYVVIDGTELPAGSPLSMEHRSGASLEKWTSLVGKASSILAESFANLQRLAEQPVTHAEACYLYASEQAKLPKVASIKASQAFGDAHPEGCTGLDVYRALMAQAEDTESKAPTTSVKAKLNVRENIARLIRENFSNWDFERYSRE